MPCTRSRSPGWSGPACGYDGSLHLALPPAQASDLVAHGWGVPHPWAGTRLSDGFVMLFRPPARPPARRPARPRDEDELEVVTAVVDGAHACAYGPPG